MAITALALPEYTGIADRPVSMATAEAVPASTAEAPASAVADSTVVVAASVEADSMVVVAAVDFMVAVEVDFTAVVVTGNSDRSNCEQGPLNRRAFRFSEELSGS